LIESALTGVPRLFASGQVFREYLVVATRPKKNNGLGMLPKNALENVAAFRRCIHRLGENNGVADRLATLIRKHKLSGKRIHDANIAATMLEHSLKDLITLNPGDFEAIREIEVIEP
jgi:predicted nucleic acid-binding protein